MRKVWGSLGLLEADQRCQLEAEACGLGNLSRKP